MKNQKGAAKLVSIIVTLILVIILIVCLNIYKKNYFNGFQKAKTNQTQVKFTRDSEVKYSEHRSFKLENIEYNDSTFYKEIEVEPDTPYKLSCMVKTENVQCEVEGEEGGVTIGLLDTTEYSEAITGTNDWQYVEFMFNSKNRDKVKISYRLGGNQNNCTGTAWFSDLKLEKGIKSSDTVWNVGCFIIKELDVNIEGKQYNIKINLDDIDNVRLNMERAKNDLYEYTGDRMVMNYEIQEVNVPITSITYSEEHGNFLSYIDVKDAIYDIAKEKKYDHIYVVCRMEDPEGKITIPIKDNWIGLGGMDMYGIGYSLIRINKNANNYTYKYGITNHLPEEVYLHEILHTFERNLMEYGYEIPELHDYKKYGYTEAAVNGLSDWYRDYMQKRIEEQGTGKYIGLDSFAYQTQPPNSEDFKYGMEIEINIEPQNIFEEINAMIDVLVGE